MIYQQVNSLNRFKRRKTASSYNLSYGFIDYQGTKQQVSFDIKKTDHEKAITKFGFNQKEIYQKINEILKKESDAKLKKSGLNKYVEFVFKKNGEIENQVKAPSDVYHKVIRESKKLLNYLGTRRENLFKQLLANNGFIVSQNIIQIDFNQLVQWNYKYIRGCFDALKEAGKGYSLTQYLGLFLAFVQEIRYKIPPVVSKGKNINGFWVPSEVLINNAGDCDSKAIVFCCLWKYVRKSPIVIFQTIDHVLIGVAGVEIGAGQQYTKIKGKKYIFCEVAGPGKLPPGNVEKKYDILNYVFID